VSATPEPAEIAHSAGSRLRLKLTRRADAARLEELADRIADCDGVARVTIRPNTGSVIVEGAVPAATLAERLESGGVVKLGRAASPPPIGQMMQAGLMRADIAIRQRSEGAADLRSTLALLLFAGSLIQTTRGRVAGPATTLAMAALALIDRGGSGK